ncbi:hypothetical protein Spith_0250 [Spirochaeta thermophila DSM 6578]|uniref:Uncharacterized protein n=1 Tax=Winmispira thermophila (strain ATCC 700085 / DSM 6578 / Z-1203) TaxID=869211 RepID=G0GDB0_WINT7|nr:hypothetical protein [Spirochaeta thermophila]AEJ60536.1 hypothetical protein Spith_0250 [Spirochaeta thermophila DSM 6578]
MKRITAGCLLVVCVALPFFGQEAVSVVDEPGVATVLLREYVAHKQLEAASQVDEFASFMTGLVLIGAGSSLFIWLDDVTSLMASGNPSWSYGTTYTAAWVLTGGGIVLTTVGLHGLAVPRPAVEAAYAEVLEVSDPATRDVLASGVLRDVAEAARQRRTRQGTWTILTPVVALGTLIGVNLVQGKDWGEGVDGYWLTGSLGAVVSGIRMLSTPSYEERLYERYLLTSTYDMRSGAVPGP